MQLLGSLVPAGSFQVPGAQLFAGVNNVPRSPVNPDYHEWQPRFGAAYQLGKNTVIRGGVGRFTQADYIVGGQNGFSRSTDFVASQNNFFTRYDTLANPFQNGLLNPTGSSLGPLTNLGQGVSWDDPNLYRAYSWEYSIHLQHQFKDWLLEAGYSHNKTYGIAWSWNQNLPSFSLWQQLQTPQFSAAGRPQDQLRWNQLVPNPFYELPGVTGSLASTQTLPLNQLLNPNPLLTTIGQNKPTRSNQYDALLVKGEHRFGKGISMIDSFTWSKLFEDTSFLGPQIAGPVVEHKLGGEDRPFSLSLTGIWNLPFGRGRKWGAGMPKLLDAIAGGWELTGTYSAQSGVPLSSARIPSSRKTTWPCRKTNDRSTSGSTRRNSCPSRRRTPTSPTIPLGPVFKICPATTMCRQRATRSKTAFTRISPTTCDAIRRAGTTCASRV